jgi:cardiolipin synthase
MGGRLADLELLVGSGEFWRRAAGDVASARRRLFVQAMTFEGDSAGLPVAAAIETSGAADRRVLVDGYTRMVVNDRFVWSPRNLFDGGLRAEVHSTERMLDRLTSAGVKVRLTNPIGPFLWRYPARNHKKLIVADDVAYIGGINFSDHNFAWRDFMLRLEGEAVAAFLADDFAATFAGDPRPSKARFGDLRLHAMDGRGNADGFGEVLRMIDGARSEITVISPYLTFPFTNALARAARRGLAVRLITPLANNKPIVRDYLLAAAARCGMDVRLLAEMSHEKGILIDRERLVIGSSNFDFVSLAVEEELMAIVESPALIDAFERRIIAPALAAALPRGAGKPSRIAGQAARVALHLADRLVQGARRSKRTARDWRG